MPAAVRVGDVTSHGGIVIGPGVASVLIAGKPAAVVQDIHSCSFPPEHGPVVSPFPQGSTKVFIAGKPALRVGDICLCGASVLVGAVTVDIS